MKRIVLMALLALALPLAAFAGPTIDFSSNGGTVYYGPGGVTDVVSPSLITTITGFPGLSSPISGPDLGKITFTTGALSGTTFSDVGSSFYIYTNGTDGLPTGTIFSGAFSGGPSTDMWNCIAKVGCFLSGEISGTWEGGLAVNGITVQVTLPDSCTTVGDVTSFTAATCVQGGSGDTTVTVPEPGTLGLLGTGLVGIAGVVRRKLFGA